MPGRNQLTLIEGSTKHDFTIFQDRGGRDLEILAKEWEVGDPLKYWKIPLHPWDAGLNSDRLENFRCYAKANADLSNKGLLVPPPLITDIIANNFVIRTRDSTVVADVSGGDTGTGAWSLSGNNVDVAPGDIILIHIAVTDADAVTITNTVGSMTALNQITNGVHKSRLFYKVFADDGDSFTFTFGATVDAWSITVMTVQGVDNSSPIDVSSTQSDSTTPYSTSSITPSANNGMIVGFASGNVVGAFTDPTGWTNVGFVTNNNGTSYITTSVAYKSQTTAAAITGDFTGANGDSALYAIALRRASPTFTGAFSKIINWNSKSWTFSGSSLLSIDSSYNLVIEVVKSTITDICVFGNELFVAQGYSTKMYKVTTTDSYTIATDNTYAGKLAVVGKNFWRSTSSVSVSSCTTDPLTLTSWGTAYTVGNSSWDINVLIDYAGSIWVGKPDGFYAPDVNSNFWNQTPQLLQYPDDDNCLGAFTAKGYLWAPTIAGLLRITYGESVFKGPELSNRPDFRWHTHAGFGWGDTIFLACHDHAAVENTCIIKMTEDEYNLTGRDYIYHEWARLGNTTAAEALGLTIQPTNPSLLIGHGTTLKYIKLGRGGGRDIDDPNYGYGLSWEYESGLVKPVADSSLITGLIGVIIVTDQDASETIDTIQYKIEEGSYTNMLTNQESGSGTMPITNTSGYTSVTRYASATSNQGQFFGFKLAGSLSDAHLGTDRPEIREIYAFGYTRPRTTDLIKVKVIAGSHVLGSNGIRQGRTAGDTARQLKAWKRDQTTLSLQIADYEEGRTTRFRVVGVSDVELTNHNVNGKDVVSKGVELTLQRDDFAGEIYNA